MTMLEKTGNNIGDIVRFDQILIQMQVMVMVRRH